MKKQNKQTINMLLSPLLVSSMFLTNAGQILVYASEAHTSTEDEEKTNEVIEVNESTSPLQIETSEEENQDVKNKFDEIYEKLSSVLDDDQRSVIVVLLDQDELSSLLQEAIVLHEAEEFEESIMYYEDVLSVLDEQKDSEIIDLEEQIKLIREFKELASEGKYLHEEYKEAIDENPAEEENLPIEEAEEVPSNDESVEQEVESTNQEEVPAEKDTMASSVKEETADPILSEKNIKYEGKLNREKDGINTKPYGTEGYKTIRLVNDWVGKKIRVTKEAITPRATWAYVQVVGTNVSGWIDKKGLEIDTITSQKDVLYDAKLLRAADGINSKPYGTEGYKTNRLVGDLVGQQVRVTKEAVTPRATWAYIE